MCVCPQLKEIRSSKRNCSFSLEGDGRLLETVFGKERDVSCCGWLLFYFIFEFVMFKCILIIETHVSFFPLSLSHTQKKESPFKVIDSVAGVLVSETRRVTSCPTDEVLV